MYESRHQKAEEIKQSISEAVRARQGLIDRMYRIISEGKQGIDALILGLGRMLAEAVMHLERANIAVSSQGSNDTEMGQPAGFGIPG